MLKRRFLWIAVGILVCLFIVYLSQTDRIVITNYDQTLEDKLGDRFGYVKELYYIGVGGKSINYLTYYRLDSLDIELDDTDNVLDKAVREISKFVYVDDQSDPNLLFTHGGNCQAVSIYLYEVFKSKGLNTGFIYEPNHMLVWVDIEGSRYYVDLIKNVIHKEDVDRV